MPNYTRTLDPRPRPRFAVRSDPMSTTDEPDPPPLHSWPRTYALVCIAATITIALLYWLTAAFDHGVVK